MAYYLNPVRSGLDQVISNGDGVSIYLKWFQAYPNKDGYQIAYHIYYSTIKENIFYEGVKYISIDESLEANILDLTPGQQYFFCVRAVEYNPLEFDLSVLPIAYDNLRIYPSSLLRSNITASSTVIPLLDVTDFPPIGVIKIGAELIKYYIVDSINNNLVLSGISDRGYGGTSIRNHNVDGYDGYFMYNPAVTIYTLGELTAYDHIFVSQSRFEYPNYSATLEDGYKQVTKDLLTSDLSASDAYNEDFPSYDYAGYHRGDPTQLVAGECVGSYIMGEYGCIDEFGNVNLYRPQSLQDTNTQRQEMLLTVTGRPAVLIQRMRTGIVCSCYQPSREYADDRCPKCHGGKFVLNYSQYFNPRRSDGRIMVRIGPAAENNKMYEAGLESEFPIDCWTLTVPTIKNRDIIVLFDQDGNEEYRYEVMEVTRNNTVLELMGGQKFRALRIRKTDPAYQIKIFRDTSDMPAKVNTGIGFTSVIPPHTHTIVRNEKDPSKWEQNTSVSQGHNHQVIFEGGNLIVKEVLGHNHTIII